MLEGKDIILPIGIIIAILYLLYGGNAEASFIPLQDYIDKISKENGIDPDLVRAIIQVESGWRPNAVRIEPSGYKSIGLMQVTMQAARDIGYTGSEENLFNPYTNIKCGVKYLKKMLDTFNGNIYKAIAAYNAGPGNVMRGNFSFGYLNKVLREYKKVKLEGKHGYR